MRLEQLEERLAPAIVTWDGGGDATTWTQAANWAGDMAPTPNDDAVIGAAFASATIAVPSDVTVRSFNSAAMIQATGGTFAIGPTSGSPNSVIGNAFTVQSAATLVVGTDARVVIQSLRTLTVSGTLNIGTGARISTQEAQFASGSSGITVNAGGLVTANGTSFERISSFNEVSQLQVNAGGRLTASNSTFTWDLLSFLGGSVLNPGDMSGNAFDQTVQIPVTHAPQMTGNRRFQDVNLLAGNLPSGQTVALNPLGTETVFSMRYVIPSLQTLTVSGTLNIGNGTRITTQEAQFASGSSAITVNAGGLVTASGASFERISSFNEVSLLQVNAGGRLTASNSTFTWDLVSFLGGSVLNPGDLTNNAFDQTVQIPVTHAPQMTGNRRFQDVNLLAGNLPIGQTVTLNPLGTETVFSMRYVIPSLQTLTVSGTLNIGTGTRITTQEAQFASGSSGITVNTGGVVNASGVTFERISSFNEVSLLQVNSGGRLTASNSTFTWDLLSFLHGSQMNPGDLSNNAFDQTVQIPVTHAPQMTGNRRFQDVNLLAGNLPIGQTVALNPLGTETIFSMRYVIPSLQTLTVSGTLNIGNGTRITTQEAQFASGSSGITVNTGGVVNASGATFERISSFNEVSLLQVNSGGRLTASNSTFTWDLLTFLGGSVLNPGDLSGNAFDQTVQIPVTHAPQLCSNRRFQNVNLLAGNLPAGQTVTLHPLGTETFFSMRYVIPSLQTVTVNGTLEISNGTRISTQEAQFASGSSGITVNTGGLVTASGATFDRVNSFNEVSLLQVNAGGRLTAASCTFAWDQLNLTNGSTGVLRLNFFASQLAIASGTSFTISPNDFSNAAATVLASGPAADTIDLRGNYWGTIDSAAIENKITHRPDAPVGTRPLVLFDPFLNASPPQPVVITGIKFNDLNGNSIRDGAEPVLGGVLVYLDANNNGAFDVGERSMVTQAVDDPCTPGDDAGLYRFDTLDAGAYVVREMVPAGFNQTFPLLNAVETTVFFDNSGEETGITIPGATTFSFKNAAFSGGAVFSPGDANLRASGNFVYNANAGTAVIDFGRPIDSVRFFYVHGSGIAAGTATALAVDGTFLGAVNSRAATTMGDPDNFVTLDPALPIARLTFSGGVIDNFRFTTRPNDPAHVVRVPPGQTAAGLNFGNQVIPTFIVDRITPTNTGFIAEFNRAFNPTVLNLYTVQTGGMGPADVTLTGNTSGPVRGSVVFNASNTSFTFIRTGGPLAPDTYTVTLRSSADGFKDMGGALLDGNRDGTAGDNHTSTFLVASSSAVVVSIPDFARGPDQQVNIPANTTTGIPLRLNNPTGVDSVDLTLRYDPALLTITGAVRGPLTPSDAQVFLNTSTPGVAILSFSSATPLMSNANDFVLLTANVPAGAVNRYIGKHVLDITNLLVNDVAARDDDGLHINVYLGDTNANGSYSSLDAQRVARVVVGLDGGFQFFPLGDPTVVADITGNGLLTSLDSTRILQKVVDLEPGASLIPSIPTGITIPQPPGPDPLLRFSKRLRGRPAQTITVPLLLDPADSLQSADLAITYDAQLLEVMEVRRGSLTQDFDLFLHHLDSSTGTLRVGMARTAGAVAGGSGSVLEIVFRIRSDAPAGRAIVNLRRDLGTMRTQLNEDGLDLNPDPSNGAGDALDGAITIVAPRSTSRSLRTTPAIDAVFTELARERIRRKFI